MVVEVVGFADLQLRPQTRSVLTALGLTDTTPIQAQAIPPLLAGSDVLGQARTGSGKTLAFAVPIVERCDPTIRGVQALVLAPTRELALQIGTVLTPLAAAHRLSLTLVYGGRSIEPQAQALARGAQLVVGTPGRILDHLRQGSLSLRRLRVMVLDEGDQLLDSGFAPDVERILAQTPSERQTALFSATLPPWVEAIAARHLRTPVAIQVDRELPAPPAIEHQVYTVDASTKVAALRSLLDLRGGGSVIVFGRTKHGVKKLARQLGDLGYPAAALQGNLSQNARERVLADFRSGALPILLATNVAARGLDITGLEQVVNYELPESAELFTHRVGRTGRMGRRGESITFVTPEDEPKWRQIERALGCRVPRTPWSARGVADSPTPSVATAPPPAAPPRPRPAPPQASRPAAPWRPRRRPGRSGSYNKPTA